MADESLPGTVISGRYELRRLLGSGGFGRVWRAHDTMLGVDVAVKQVQLNGGMSAEEHAVLLARAGREARNAARLRDHPNNVTVYDVVEVDGAPWIVMQLVEGHSLADALKTTGPLPVKRTGAVATALLRALGAAHEADITHRDVKPANVLLATAGAVLLADFGIAVGRGDPKLTASPLIIGSLAYMAPERWQGAPADGRADLFSLGMTLYEAVEGVPPFPVGNLAAILTESPRPPQKAGRLAPLLMDLLEKDPAERPDIPAALAAVAAARKPPAKPAAAKPGAAADARSAAAGPPQRKKVPRDPVTITASRTDMLALYTSIIGGLGLLSGLLGGIVLGKFAPVSEPEAMGGVFGAVVTLVCGLIGLIRGLVMPLDQITVDAQGLSVTQWLLPEGKTGGTGEVGTVKSAYAIRWDTVERVTVEEVAKGYYRVFAWFPKGKEPSRDWLKTHAITRRKDGGYRIYPHLRDRRSNMADRKQLRDPIRQFVPDQYDETPPFKG